MSKDLRVVSLEGSQTIQTAQKAKTQILDALSAASRVLVNINRITHIDTAFLQLLVAAKKEAQAGNKEFELTGNPCAEVVEGLILSGFCRTAPKDEQDLNAQFFRTLD